MTTMSPILFRYLAREFFMKLALFMVILLGVVYLFDTVEMIRRASGHDNVTMGTILELSLCKLPNIGQQIFPFIILFASIATFRSLSDRQELVCMRGVGLSAWQFIMPISTIVFIISLLYITLLHPLSAAAMARYKSLENIYFGDGTETITVIDDGLWLRQEDKTGNFILKAEKLDARTWNMDNVTVFFFDDVNTHTQRIDAKNAKLDKNEWVFSDVFVHRTNQSPAQLPQLSLSTTLTSDIITESFSDPETISFWKLPHFIGILKETGLDTTEMRLYFQSLLAQPIFLIAMVFLAAAISLRTERIATLMPIIVGG